MEKGSLSPKLTRAPVLFDRWLLVSVVGLIALGVLMVTSASMGIAERQFGTSFHYLIRQLCFLGLGFVIGLIILKQSISFWQRLGPTLLLACIALLVLVLIPGVGHSVNGSRRWLNLGVASVQVSEFVKLGMILYLSDYLVRYADAVRSTVLGFIKPMTMIAIISVLLLCEPDFGATVVIISTSLALLFLAGARLWQFLCLLFLVILGLAGLAIASPYRLERLTTFLNPWANQFDSGYQLTQSLIAFGRGGIWGVGLGDSVQKLFYLPEAHTDFLFAVLAEELGLIGEIVIILLFALLVFRILAIGFRAYRLERPFAAYMCYGFSLWIAMQTIVNIGVNAGLLPTKGLTLPFMSYGGSSLLVMCVVVALILRADYETRLELFGLGRVG